jgi:hypothetical protein
MMTSLSDLSRASAPPSLLASAVGLHRAIDTVESGSTAGLRAAVSQAMIAVEQELGAGSLDGGIVDPRFRSAMERLESGLSETLVLLWQTRLSEPSIVGPSPELLAIARKLPRLAEQALDLLHESMQPIGGRD